MAIVVVSCAGTVSQQVTHGKGGDTYTAMCTQPWDALPAPDGTLDAEEFAGFFFGVLISTLTFYFVVVLPLGKFLGFVRQGLRDLL